MKKINNPQQCQSCNKTNEKQHQNKQQSDNSKTKNYIKQFRQQLKTIIFTIICNCEKNLNSRLRFQEPLRSPPLLIQPINQNIYITKMETASNQSPSTHLSQSRTGLLKKIYCPEHGDKFTFRCKYPNCQAPFFCSKIQCIESHLHENELNATKFDGKVLVQNFAKVEKMMHSESVQNSVKRLKKFIDQLKNSLKHVYTNLKCYNQTYEELRGTVDSPLNLQFIQKVNTTCQLEQSIKKQMKDLKSRINFVEPVRDRDFIFKDELISFLSRQLTHFDWFNSQEIFSSNNELIPCERFHQKLSDKSQLLFIFIGEDRIVGSYFSKAYPNIKEQSKNLFDTDSFLFISPQQNYYSSGRSNNGNSSKQAVLMSDLELNDHPEQLRSSLAEQFVKFQANQEVQAHLVISKNHYISHGNISALPQGIRTFQKNIDVVDYNLPSKAYNRSTSEITFDGKLKVKWFTILQIKSQEE